MSQIVCVIAAHPDDEVLGCGATIARHVSAGDKVHIIFLADGVSSRRGENTAAEVKERLAAANKAAKILGAEPPKSEELPDNRLDTVPLLDVVQRIESHLNDIRPSIVYTHHRGDLNIDHRIVYTATMTACRPAPGNTVRCIYAFETPSRTEWLGPNPETTFLPQRFVAIADFMELKRQALEAYATEIRDFPHARSLDAIVALATWRGASVGLDAAEAFEIVRQIDSP